MKQQLFVTVDFPPSKGGIARYYDEITRRWSISDITVLAPRTAARSIEGKRQIIPISTHISFLWPHWIGMFFQILFRLFMRPTSLIHIGQVLPVGTAVYLATRLQRIPYVIYTHGMDLGFASRSQRKHKLARRIIENASLVVANSYYTKALLNETYPKHPEIVVAHPGTTELSHAPQNAVEQLKQRHGLQNHKILLTVSRIVKRKGIDKMLEALAILDPKLQKDLMYVIVGDGPDRARVERLSRALGVEHLVMFRGKVSDEELSEWYTACDVFCLLTRTVEKHDVEGFGIVYLEANLFGKPVIAGNSGGVPEAVEDRVSGLLVDPNQPEEIALAVRELLEDKKLYQELSGKAIAHAKKFSWDATVRSIEKFTKNIVL